MAVTVTLTADKTTYNVGDTITLTYTVTGATASTITFTGTVTVDGTVYPASTGTIIANHAVTYTAPTGGVKPIVATGSANVFTTTAA